MIDKEIDEEIVEALKEADDIQINDYVDCYDVLCYIEDLKDEIAGLTGALEAARMDRDNLLQTLKERNEDLVSLREENDRLMTAQINRLELLSLQMKNGEIDMTFGSDNCDAFVYSILQMFKQNGGQNFVSTTLEVDGKELGGRYALTIQKVGGLTPIEKVRKETAKEIFEELAGLYDCYGEHKFKDCIEFRQKAKEYGVEVDE